MSSVHLRLAGVMALLALLAATGERAAAHPRRAAVTAAAPAPPDAKPASPADAARARMARGLALEREASYAASVAALEQARATGQLTDAERHDCDFHLAADYVAMDSLPAARRELHALLAEAPSYELPLYTSPKVAALFREVRDELER